jgi:Ca2+-binding RTX toxin-like protein
MSSAAAMGSGADRLLGGLGRDRIRGGRGEDVLFGGRGKDSLNAGPTPCSAARAWTSTASTAGSTAHA